MIRGSDRQIKRLCHLHGKNPSKREELHQTILCELYRSMDSFRGDCQISTWAYRVTLNTCLKHVEAEEFEKLRDLDVDVDSIEIPPEISVEDQIDFNFMINYASTFKPIDRELIYLYLIGESQQDIADVLGLSLTNVSTKLNRLWKRIDEYMNKGAEDVK